MNLLASVTRGLVARDTARASATHSDQNVQFKRFVIFLNKYGLGKDPLITKFRRSHHNGIMLALAHSIRCNEHGKITKYTKLAGTVKATIGDLSKTFREEFRRDPKRDANNKRFSLITTFISETNTETQTPDIVLASLWVFSKSY